MYGYYQPPQMPTVAGKLVNDFSEIAIRDIPTDGSCAYFIKADGSEIQARRWNENGMIIPISYVRAEAEPQTDPLQDRLDAIESRLEKIEKSRRRKEPEDEQ